jgi:hypothetical protein
LLLATGNIVRFFKLSKNSLLSPIGIVLSRRL